MKTVREEKIEQLPVAKIRPSPNNHRKRFDKVKFEELKASIKENGVHTPIWVRKIYIAEHNNDEWEIIAGERRHRACKELGLATIPAIVKVVKDDQEAIILSLIENDQREDVNPLEQADAYQDVLNRGKHTPETLAAALGKQVPYVLGRLKLLKLSPKAQAALREGKIEYGHAILVARIKDQKDQDEFLGQILDKWEPLSVAMAKSVLNEYSLRLAGASFDVKTVCASCSHRSRNQATLFPEDAKRGDECFNKACFVQKTREHYEQLVKDLEAKGMTVLTDAAEVRAAKAAGKEISPDPDEYDHPKKYRSMCATCVKRVLFVVEQGRSFATGEICRDTKCYNTMNGIKDYSGGRSSSGPVRKGPTNAAIQHAVFMRDRFLRSRLPAKYEVSETLRLRLAIYHILCRFERFGGSGRTDLKMDHHQVFKALMKDIYPSWKPAQYGSLDDQTLYAAVATIPEKQLSAVFKRVILASVPHTDEEVLLQATPEAGITLEKDFLVDEQYLNTLTKGELIKLEREWKLGGMTPLVNTTMKKPEIIKTMLSRNLTGKVPSLVEKECKIVSLGAAAPKKRGK